MCFFHLTKHLFQPTPLHVYGKFISFKIESEVEYVNFENHKYSILFYTVNEQYKACKINVYSHKCVIAKLE